MSAALAVSVPQALARIDRTRTPHYLTRDQITALVGACRNGRDRLLVQIAWGTGGRISELLGLSRSDFDASNRQIRLRTSKRRTDGRYKPREHYRWIPVSDSLAADVATFLLDQAVGENDQLFPFTRQRAFSIIRDAGRRAGLVARGGRDISPHILRHSYAMNCITHGVPINVLKELLGHSSILSTMVYLKIDPAEARTFLSRVEF